MFTLFDLGQHITNFGSKIFNNNLDASHYLDNSTHICRAYIIVLCTVQEHPILVHTFSNGGCRVYRYLSDLVHNSKAFSSITLSGVIFDSCPSRLHINRGVQVYMSVCNRSLVVKYFLAACLFICFLMLTVFPRCAQWISSSWVLVDDFWAFMWKDPASCPHLYLYSVKDSLVPYGEVEEMIAERRCRGVHVQTQCWDDSEHVAHFVAHRETYMTACLEFLQLCTSHTV